MGVVEPEGWAEQTRRVLTRDLIIRARQAPIGEGRSLQFRALHLNLPLVGAVADDLGLAPGERYAVEHAALDGLFEAIRRFDPWADLDFAAFATPYVRSQMVTHLPAARRRAAHARELPPRSTARRGAVLTQHRLVRLAVVRAAQAMAGYRL